MIPRMDSLTQALRLLASEMSILPATGGAVEDLQHPDPDEIEDALINRDSGDITEFLEYPRPNFAEFYRPTPPLFRMENHLYRFFIDGSIRTYYLATGIEDTRSFPIELAQIGAAVMIRDNAGRVRTLEARNRILLLLPHGQYGVSDTVWNRLSRLSTSDGYFTVRDTTESP